MKRIFLLLLLFVVISPVNTWAQNIAGKLVDGNNSPVAYANVVLQKADSTYLVGTTTDENGMFSIPKPADAKLINISFVGFQSVSQRIEADDLGTIQMKVNDQMLQEVVINGNKAIINREVDRLVVDVSRLPQANFTLLDLLKQTPGVKADDNNVQIIGKGGVKIYINGRDAKSSGRDLVALLRSYHSEDVQRLEIITNPPAVYEAEGNSGIINIVLKRQINDYLGGNLSEILIVNKWTANEYSGRVNYKSGRLTASFNLSGGFGEHGFEKQYNRIYSTQSQLSQTTQRNDNAYMIPRLSFDISLPHKWSVGGIVSYLRMTPDCNNRTNTEIKDNQDVLLKSISGATDLVILTQRQDYNIHADKLFGDGGKMISIDADAVLYKTSSNDDYTSNTDFQFHSLLERHIDIYSVKSNLYLPWEKFAVNVGGKYSTSKTRNNYTLYEAMPNMQEDRFNYQENILAVYADGLWEISSMWQFKMGLRMENTHTDAKSITTASRTERNYAKFFPSAYLSYKPNAENVITLSGSRRLSRPSYVALNPAVLYENEYSYSTGNPYLTPSFSYQAQLGYTYRGNLNFEVSYQTVDDGFGQLIKKDSQSNVSYANYYNYFNKQVFMLTNSYTYNKLKWLQIHLQHGAYWTEAKSDSQYSDSSYNGWTYFLQNHNYFYFNRKKSFTGYLILDYCSKTYAADSYANPTFALSIGAKYTWIKQKIALALSANDIIATHNKGVYFSNGLTTRYNHTYRYPTFQMSLTWRWGGNIKATNRNKANNEELYRL